MQMRETLLVKVIDKRLKRRMLVILVINTYKILVTLVLFITVWRYQHMAKKRLLCFLICTLLFSLLSHIATLFLPPVTDSVRIQALGEKSASAQADEIWLNGIIIDGKTIQISMPQCGKWFWIGENYVWRNENDARQPQGTTREIILNIPVGNERMLRFNTNQYSGICKIITKNEEMLLNAYSGDESTTTVMLERSNMRLLVYQAVRNIIVFTGVLFSYIIIYIKLGKRYDNLNLEKKNYLKNAINKRIGIIIVAIVSFVLMMLYANVSSFWSDELAQVGFASRGIVENILLCIRIQDFTPPLYDIICSIWYRIAPFGEQWLLLISIVPTVMAIYFIGRIANEITDSTFGGILCSLLMATSSTVWIRQAYELRSYAFPLFFSTLALYAHVMRKKNKIWECIFSLAILGMAMSHYFAMLICGMFFLADALLCWKKIINFRKLVCYYFFPAVFSILWIGIVYFFTLRHMDSSQLATWYVVPTLNDVHTLIQFLAGNNKITIFLFEIGFCAAIVGRILYPDRAYEKKYFYLSFSCATVILMISAIFLYGNFINEISTKWEIRYFLVLTPFVWLLASVWFASALHKMNKICLCCKPVCQYTAWAFLAISLTTSVVETVKVPVWPVEPYRQSADWLYEQANDIYSDKTATIVMTSQYVSEGWSEYYLTQQGRRDPINCYCIDEFINPETELLEFDKLYIQYTLVGIPQPIQEILDQNFEMQEDRTDLTIKVYTKKQAWPQEEI